MFYSTALKCLKQEFGNAINSPFNVKIRFLSTLNWSNRLHIKKVISLDTDTPGI